jgi:hypothetical protein
MSAAQVYCKGPPLWTQVYPPNSSTNKLVLYRPIAYENSSRAFFVECKYSIKYPLLFTGCVWPLVIKLTTSRTEDKCKYECGVAVSLFSKPNIFPLFARSQVFFSVHPFKNTAIFKTMQNSGK